MAGDGECFSFDRLWQFRGQRCTFVELRQKSNVLYCENQTGKTNSKKAEAKTVTPVDGVNKTIISIWHRGWIGDLFGAIYFGAPSFMHLSS